MYSVKKAAWIPRGFISSSSTHNTKCNHWATPIPYRVSYVALTRTSKTSTSKMNTYRWTLVVYMDSPALWCMIMKSVHCIILLYILNRCNEILNWNKRCNEGNLLYLILYVTKVNKPKWNFQIRFFQLVLLY